MISQTEMQKFVLLKHMNRIFRKYSGINPYENGKMRKENVTDLDTTSKQA